MNEENITRIIGLQEGMLTAYPKKKNAIGYIRIPTSESKRELDEQILAIKEFADNNGYEVVSWQKDVTAKTNDNRTALNKILYGDCYNPPIDAIITYEPGAIATDINYYMDYFYILERKHIKLLCVKEDFGEDNKIADRFKDLVLFIIEQERNGVKIRTANGRTTKAKNGGYIGGNQPYGYHTVGKRLEIYEAEVPLVKEIFELWDSGMSLLAISNQLNEEGKRTRKGTTFTHASIKSIVVNRKFYLGYTKYGETSEWVVGQHEPILTKSDNDRYFMPRDEKTAIERKQKEKERLEAIAEKKAEREKAIADREIEKAKAKVQREKERAKARVEERKQKAKEIAKAQTQARLEAEKQRAKAEREKIRSKAKEKKAKEEARAKERAKAKASAKRKKKVKTIVV